MKIQGGTQSFPITGSGANHALGSEESSQFISGLCSQSPEHLSGFSIQSPMNNNEQYLHVEVFRWFLSLGVRPEVNLFASPMQEQDQEVLYEGPLEQMH